MTPTLPIGHELEVEWRCRVIHERNALESMEMSFFALPSNQGPVQGRFKPMHIPISLSTRVPACVLRFETPTALNDGRPALAHSFKSSVWLRRYFISLLSLLMPYEPVLGQGQSQKKTSPYSFLQ
jgi:hypothetical protein